MPAILPVFRASFKPFTSKFLTSSNQSFPEKELTQKQTGNYSGLS